MIRRPPRSTPLYSSAASDVYKRQVVALVDDKPTKGTFFKGSKIKEVRHRHFNIRRKLQEKRRLDVFKRLRGKERRIVNHELHVISKEIVEYAKQFPSPVLVMERLRY